MRSWPTLLGLALLTACAESPPALEVGGVAFSEEDLLGLTSARREALAELTALGVAVAEGRADSVGRPLVQQWGRERLAELLRAERLLDSLGVGEDALRARYETDPEVELTVRHLLVFSARFETDATRAGAREKAERALERIRAGEDFGRVAAEVSEEPGADSREGLLQPGREGSWVREFWNAALALPVGGVSPVVETQYGFHVLRLEGREPVPFQEARNRVLLEVVEMVGVPPGSGPAAPAPAGATLSEMAAQRLQDPEAPDGETAVSWTGGTLTLGQLRDYLATLEAPRYHAVLDASRAPALDSAASTAAAWVETERLARELAIEVGPAHEAELARRWSDTWSAWAQTLRFTPGASSEGVRQAALGALTATGQNAALAREAVHARGPLLRRAHPPRVAAPAGGETTTPSKP